MNDLIMYLLNFALDNGIAWAIKQEDPYFPPMSFHKSRKLIVNMNWHNKWEIPFMIGHEIGHLMNDDPGISYYHSATVRGSAEREADLYSLNLIFDYAMAQCDPVYEPIEFMQQYGIPERMLNDTVKLFRNNYDLLF